VTQPPAGARRGARPLAPSRVQRTIARRAAEARATIPDLELGIEVEFDRALGLCERGGHTSTALLVWACARALREHPRANAAYRDGQFELYERVNVGLLVSDEDDLVLATVFDADQKSLSELTGEIAELQRRADALTQPERSGSTFALSREDRVGWAEPIVFSGHAAALSAGSVREAPVVRGGEVVPGHLVSLRLACDHRIFYGAPAARFLARIKQLLETAGG
jgi:pyruvate dehydrogenase E2 component (dihydrolipoamide acetyltransferase)